MLEGRKNNWVEEGLESETRGSWRGSRDGAVHLGINCGRHETRPVDLGFAGPELRFEMEGQESVEGVVGQESEQQEALDGVGIVTVDVVRVPAVHQFIEPVVFDIPALVS